MSKTTYAVLGHPIGHTLSPYMHNAAFSELGLDAEYISLDVEPQQLIEKLSSLKDRGFGGLNLTIPLKEVAFKGLDELDDSAKKLGAVNTVEFTSEGGVKGHNTDGAGFLTAVEEAFSTTVEGLSIFIMGCGGAGRAVAITSACAGAKSLALTDLDNARIDQLAKEISELTPEITITKVPSDPAQWNSSALEADLVVQATPVGMKEDDKPLLDKTAFRVGQMVFDLVYMYPQTSIMKPALEAGAQASNGLGMLLHQGAIAFSIWTKKEAPIDVMRKALEKEVYK